MSSQSATSSSESYWVERAADRVGLNRVSLLLTGGESTKYAPALLMLLVTLIDVIILSGVEIPRPGVYRIQNPGAPALIVAWPVVMLTLVELRSKYDAARKEIQNIEPDNDLGDTTNQIDSRFRRILKRLDLLDDKGLSPNHRIVPIRLKLTILLLAIGFHYVWLSTAPFNLPAVTQLHAWADIRVFFKFYVFVPATYYVAGTEFISLLLAVHILFPFRVRESGKIDFSDPQGYAGLRPAGRLVMRSSVLFLVLVTIFGVFVSLPGGVTWDGIVPKVLIVAGSVLAIVLFVAPVFWLHRYMAGLKEAKIDAIASRVQNVGPDDMIFPNTDFESSDDVMAYTHEYISLNRVESTAEYPVDVQMVQDLTAMLVLPYFTAYTSDLLFNQLL